MAKAVSLHGAVVGKLASNVYSVNSGVQIVRAYQPNVSNPSTEMQVDTRSRFKLCSQLAAAVSTVLAIPKNGLVSARNQFVSQTMAITEQVEGVASATVSFMTQKLNVEFAEGADEKAVMKAVVKACKKVEADCEIYL